jgi:hypothetical protein
MLTRLRARSPGAANYSPMPLNFGYGIPPAQGGYLTLPPADTLPQSPSGATRATMRGSVNGPVEAINRVVAESRTLGLDPVQLADEIARRLESALTPMYDGMRYATFQSVPISIGTADQVVLERPTTKRVYLFLICTHPTQDLFVAFDRPATVLDCPIRQTDGFFEWLFVIPQNVIHLIASGGGTTGVVISAELDPRASNREPAQSAPPRVETDVAYDALPTLAMAPTPSNVIPLTVAPSYVAPARANESPMQALTPAQPSNAFTDAQLYAPVAGPVWNGEGWDWPGGAPVDTSYSPAQS